GRRKGWFVEANLVCDEVAGRVADALDFEVKSAKDGGHSVVGSAAKEAALGLDACAVVKEYGRLHSVCVLHDEGVCVAPRDDALDGHLLTGSYRARVRRALAARALRECGGRDGERQCEDESDESNSARNVAHFFISPLCYS